jgi:SAM-dependent methyltransferase
MSTTDGEAILEHYRSEAEQHGLAPSSTMADQVTRRIELDSIERCVAYAAAQCTAPPRVLEVGCGNGHLLALLREWIPESELVGSDFTPEMVELARGRGIDRCTIDRQDVRSLTYDTGSFDLLVSERCVINVLDRAEQETALGEFARVLAPGGYLVLIEAFLDGLENLNRARTELGLEPNVVPHHNLWFEHAWFDELIARHFEPVDDPAAGLPPTNALSSHYFVSRVLYPAVTQREVLYNTEFVKFFDFLPPRGAFAPIEVHFLRRRV